MTHVPAVAGPFFSTPEQRLALARQRYFEEGMRPSGLVSEAVIQSWSRCTQARRHPRERIAFEPVTPSRLHGVLARNRALLQAAAHELERLEQTLAGTRCRALLTDGEGIVVHATRNPSSAHETLIPIAARVGVNLGESVVGTTAPGVVAKTGTGCTVLGGEHFFDAVQVMHCAAAPIRDVHGRVAGVLDLSIESRPFGFDASSVVGLSAMAIENRLLQAQSDGVLVLRFQTVPSLLDGPFEGLAGIDANGRVAWLNGAGARLVGQRTGAAEELFGCTVTRLLQGLGRGGTVAVPLPNGLKVWMRARLPASDGLESPPAADAAGPAQLPSGSAAASAEDAASAPTLGEHSRKLIEDTVAACGGNLSEAARRLGVSRGLLYRRLRDATPRPGGRPANASR